MLHPPIISSVFLLSATDRTVEFHSDVQLFGKHLNRHLSGEAWMPYSLLDCWFQRLATS